LAKFGELCQGEIIYGIYTDYESDETADYRFIVGSSAENLADKELVSVQIQSGNYHKFSFIGEAPQVVIEGWQHVWKYYSDNDYNRSFQTDFELYTPEGVDIYIGVE